MWQRWRRRRETDSRIAAMTVMHEDCRAHDFVDRGEAAGVTTGGFGGSREGSGGEALIAVAFRER